VESVDDGARPKEVVDGAKGGEQLDSPACRDRKQIGPRGGDVGPALIGKDEDQI